MIYRVDLTFERLQGFHNAAQAHSWLLRFEKWFVEQSGINLVNAGELMTWEDHAKRVRVYQAQFNSAAWTGRET